MFENFVPLLILTSGHTNLLQSSYNYTLAPTPAQGDLNDS